jgi:hypothetical protein
LLLKKQSELPHGEFQKWIALNCTFKYSTAHRYMVAAKKKSTGVEIPSLSALFPSGAARRVAHDQPAAGAGDEDGEEDTDEGADGAADDVAGAVVEVEDGAQALVPALEQGSMKSSRHAAQRVRRELRRHKPTRAFYNYVKRMPKGTRAQALLKMVDALGLRNEVLAIIRSGGAP